MELSDYGPLQKAMLQIKLDAANSNNIEISPAIMIIGGILCFGAGYVVGYFVYRSKKETASDAVKTNIDVPNNIAATAIKDPKSSSENIY